MWVIAIHKDDTEYRDWKLKSLLKGYQKPRKIVADRLHKVTYRYIITSSIYSAKVFETKEAVEEFINECVKSHSDWRYWNKMFVTFKNRILTPCEISRSKYDYILKERDRKGYTESTEW